MNSNYSYEEDDLQDDEQGPGVIFYVVVSFLCAVMCTLAFVVGRATA